MVTLLGWVTTMPEPREAGLDPAHILAICKRATGGRRSLAVRKASGIIVCILPSQRTAHRASTALRRVGYEVTSVSAGHGRDLLVTGWDPAVLESRLATMRTILHQLADNPSVTARGVIERYRDLPPESRARQQQWGLLNQARIGLRDWVTTRSGIYALRDSTIQRADNRIAPQLRAAAVLEQVIGDHVQRQLRVAGYALALFRHLSGRTDGDAAEQTAIRWAGVAFHLGGSAADGSSSLMSSAAALASGTATSEHESARTSEPGVGPMTPISGLPGRPAPAGRTAAEFPFAALAAGRPANVASLNPARRRAGPGPVPRLRT
jgi:hypothetical protein